MPFKIQSPEDDDIIITDITHPCVINTFFYVFKYLGCTRTTNYGKMLVADVHGVHHNIKISNNILKEIIYNKFIFHHTYILIVYREGQDDFTVYSDWYWKVK